MSLSDNDETLLAAAITSIKTSHVTSSLVTSKRQAREFIQSGAVRISGEKVDNLPIGSSFALYDRYWILQRGKKRFHLLERSQ